ncbi:MAG: DUF4190 domain-containing protein [Lysobacteraceae bacterium]
MNAVTPRTNTVAVVSLVFGILAWTLLPFIGSIVAVITGHMARAEIRRLPPGAEQGDGLALAGLVLGWVQLALIVLGFLAVVLFFGGIAMIAAIAS